MTKEEKNNLGLLPKDSKIYRKQSVQSSVWSENTSQPFDFNGQVFKPNKNSHWKTSIDGLKNLVKLSLGAKNG